MKRIIRRTSIIAPYKESRLPETNDIKEAIKNSESVTNLLTEPEKFIKKDVATDSIEKPAVLLTHSWLKRVSESLDQSAKRISDLTDKILGKKEPVQIQKEVKKESDQSAIGTPKSPQKKKEKPIKKKSSLKMAKSPYTHPTIPEADEEVVKRSESRQTQLSASSVRSGRTSIKSSVSLTKRPSTTSSGTIRRGSNSSKYISRKDSLKKIGSNFKDKASKCSLGSSVSLRDEISRRSSQKLSAQFDKPQKKRKSSTSVGSRSKISTHSSRGSSRGRSSDEVSNSSVSDIEDQRASLASLIDMYYASPSRRSTLESLEEYTKALFQPKAKEKKSKTSNRPDNMVSSEHPSDTDESYIIKRDDDTEDNEDPQGEENIFDSETKITNRKTPSKAPDSIEIDKGKEQSILLKSKTAVQERRDSAPLSRRRASSTTKNLRNQSKERKSKDEKDRKASLNKTIRLSMDSAIKKLNKTTTKSTKRLSNPKKLEASSSSLDFSKIDRYMSMAAQPVSTKKSKNKKIMHKETNLPNLTGKKLVPLLSTKTATKSGGTSIDRTLNTVITNRLKEIKQIPIEAS